MLIGGIKEYVVWGIPPGQKSETILFTKAENMQQAKKVVEILEKKHGCKECRVQVLDLSGPYDAKKEFTQAIGKVKPAKPIYKKPGKTNIAELQNQVGVYIIYENGRPVYIGSSSFDLYKIITRHFQSWNDPRQIRVTYPQSPRFKIRVIKTRTGAQALRVEKYLIRKLKPRDNPLQYEIDTSAEEDEFTRNERLLRERIEREGVPF